MTFPLVDSSDSGNGDSPSDFHPGPPPGSVQQFGRLSDEELTLQYQEKNDRHERMADYYDSQAAQRENLAQKNPRQFEALKYDAENLRSFAQDHRRLQNETREALYTHLQSDHELRFFQENIFAHADRARALEQEADALQKEASTKRNRREKSSLLSRAEDCRGEAGSYREVEKDFRSEMQKQLRRPLGDREREAQERDIAINQTVQTLPREMPQKQVSKEGLTEHREGRQQLGQTTFIDRSDVSVTSPDQILVDQAVIEQCTADLQQRIDRSHAINAEARRLSDSTTETSQGAMRDAHQQDMEELIERNDELADAARSAIQAVRKHADTVVDNDRIMATQY